MLSPEEVEKLDEAAWFARVYQRGATQLTLRAVLLGSAIGFALAFTNVYVGLKTSLHIGVNVTACILAYALTETARRVTGARRLGILEMGCAVSTASSAGFATGNTLISAFPTLLMLSATKENPKGTLLPAWVMLLWVAALALLGVAMAVFFKRDLIDREKLKFPSGTAAAVMIHNLYRRGEEGLSKARALLIASLVGAVLPILTALNLKAGSEKPGERVPLLSDHTNLFDWIFVRVLPGALTKRMLSAGGKALLPSSYKLVFGHSVFALGAGVLVGVRTSAWMVIGGLFLACVLTPIGLEWSWVNVSGTPTLAIKSAGSAISQLGPWIGAPMLVTSSFVTFGWRWRSIGRALMQPFRRTSLAAAQTEHDQLQVPARWAWIGIGIASVVLIALGSGFFGLPIHLTIVAIAMTFLLASVASRVTGETDIAPVGPLGKVMQLTYGALAPRNAIANVQSASISSGASIASADLLNDVKTGHLLGADPRRQFIAQAFGIIAGSIGTVIAFHVLIPDATALGDDAAAHQFAAPAAKTWKLVAQVMTEGLANVHPMHRTLILAGGAIGVVLTVIEKLLLALSKEKTERIRLLWPSATGLGIGMVLQFDVALGMLLGALVAAFLKKRAPSWSEKYLVVVAAGAIAGESIISIFVYALNAMR